MPCDLHCGDAGLNQLNPLTSGLTNGLLSSDGHECDGRETLKRSVIFGDASFINHSLISIGEILHYEMNDTNFQTF